MNQQPNRRNKDMKKVMAGLIVMAGVGGTCLAAETTTAAAPAPAPVVKTWADSVTIKGDLRYRYETINDDSKKNASKSTYTRERDRVRARLAAEAKANDDLKVVVGLSTGDKDPISGNQTLGDGGQKKPMMLDLAYLDYSFIGDTTANEIHGLAGKMKNPFITMNDDLMWDPDLTPEGMALKAQFGGDVVTVYGNAGYLWLQERDSKSAGTLYAGQGAVKFQFVEEASLTIGASYYGFNNVQGYDVIDWAGANSGYGNTTKNGTISGGVTNKAWASGFTPVVYSASLDLWIAGVPVSIFGQELSNTDAAKLDQGHMYGVSFGKAKNPGSFETGYSYTELQKDATVGMWTDSDRWGGGTDGKGSKIYAKYQLVKNLQLGVNYFTDDKGIASGKPTNYNRLMVDLVAAF
jgi:Putative porin